MLSRVAETLYWIGRYVERAESSARLVIATQQLLLDLPKGTPLNWWSMIDIFGSSESFRARYRRQDEASVIRFLIADEENSGSLINSITAARRNARTIREIIPREAWEQLNAIHLSLQQGLPQALRRQHRHACLSSVIHTAQQFSGVIEGTMLHNTGYLFWRLGRHLERADMTSRIIDVQSATLLRSERDTLQQTYQNIQWMSVLQSLSAYQSYRQQMAAPVKRALVVRFLLQDSEFPRAFRHAIAALLHDAQRLPGSEEVVATAAAIIAQLDSAEPGALDSTALHHYIDQLQLALAGLHQSINGRYFAAA